MLLIYTDGTLSVYLQGSRSRNGKTGDTANLWVKGAAAAHACGDCPRLDDKTCYAWRGRPGLLVRSVGGQTCTTAELRAAVRGRIVRSAVIGDAGMVPVAAWATIEARLVAAGAAKIIGYTHQWARANHLRGTHMASADSLADAQTAWAQGWRTFRVLPVGTPVWRGRNGHGEVACPSWASGGAVKCTDCGYCDGATGKKASVAIAAHGAGIRG